MNCLDFNRRLDSLLDGACSPDEWRSAEEHLASCARCRQLFEALGGRGGALDEAADASLTAAIIARTSGGACAAARGRLCDYVDDVLSPLDRGLVASHLERCAACSALAGALVRSAAVLPSFVELEPPASFATSVLAATSRRPAEASFGERAAAWFGRAAMRPRFSVGVAYAATLLILLLVGDPIQAARRVLDQGAVFVQPVFAAAGDRFAAGMDGARRLRAETIDVVASLGQRPESAATGSSWDAGVSAVRQWLFANLGAPLANLLERVSGWIRDAMDAVIRLVRPGPQQRGPSTGPSPLARRGANLPAPARV